MEIYLIRHGETEWNRLRKLQGHTDIPLNDAGLAAARLAARNIEDLRLDLVLHSPLLRARKTAELLRGSRSCPIRKETLLTEISFGIGEGLNLYEENPAEKTLRECLLRFFQDPANYVPAAGGESIPQLKSRARRVLTDILSPLEQNPSMLRVLVVAHGAILRAILDVISDIPDARFWEGPLAPNCGGSILELRNGRFRELQSVDLLKLR